ncbi:hypothetical protein NKJ46_29125 [Mesorhizobium sp. M0166]|uniref:hypothetical protein n=1 Tax=Mesorhizobium sp. M0166 TaxID=2956902 RepID=UPI00333BEE87
MAVEPRTVSLDELDNLKVGKDDQLYWKSRAIAMERRHSLNGGTLIAALLAGGGAFLGAIHPFGVSFHWW